MTITEAAEAISPERATIKRLAGIIYGDVDRGALAGLVRSWQQPDAIHPIVLKVTRTAPDADLDSHTAVAGLFGLWHTGWNAPKPEYGNGSFGAFMRRISAATMGSQGIETLFQVILTLPRGEAVRQIGIALQRGRAEGVQVPPNWERLIVDLVGWDDYNNGVQKLWAADFWRPAPKIAPTPASKTSTTSPAGVTGTTSAITSEKD